MELTREFRNNFLCAFLLLFFGNVKAQVGDLMMDTTFGELPNPLLTMAAQGDPHSSLTTSQTSTTNIAESTGGGFNIHRFPLLDTNTVHNMFPIDASRIAGVANGQTIYLPGIFGNQLYSGSPVVIPVHTSTSTSTSTTDPNQKFMLKNEDFTALGNIGHHVRVPVSDVPPAVDLPTGSVASVAHTPAPDGTITIDPKDIIGVADMNQIGPDGKPSFMSFNPGTGHASEISALQSALQGTAVDMSGFLPPPFDSPSSSFPSGSSTSSSTSFSSNTQESTNFDLLLGAGPTSKPNSSPSKGQATTVDFSNPPELTTSVGGGKTNHELSTITTSQNTQSTKEQIHYDTLINNQPTALGVGRKNNSAIAMQSKLNTLTPTLSGPTNSLSGGINTNEQSTMTSNEQSMLSTHSTGNMNERSMFEAGGNTNTINSNELSMFSTGSNTENIMSNEQSAFGTGGTTSGLSTSGINTNENSMFGTSSATLGRNTNLDLNSNVNEQSMFGTGQVTKSTNINEQSTNNVNGETYSMNDQANLGVGRTTISTGMNSRGEPTVSISSLLNLNANNINDNSIFQTAKPSILYQNVRDTTIASSSAGHSNYTNSLTTDAVNNINQQTNTFDGPRGIATAGQTDTFTTGVDRKQSITGNQNIASINIPSIKTDSQTGLQEINANTVNEKSTIKTDIHPLTIIPHNIITNEQNQFVNEPSFVNVDTKIGIKSGPAETRGTINGLLGTVSNIGGSRFSRLDNAKTVSHVGGSETPYLVSGTGFDNVGDMSLSQVDSKQSLNGGTASLLGVSDTIVDNTLSNNNEQLTLTFSDPMLSVADSSVNTISKTQSTATDNTGQNEPHLNELNTSGIYPFEGSFTAMNASLAEGVSATLDMNSVLHGREPLHLEPPMNIVGEVVSDVTTIDNTGSTGIFAVSGSPSFTNTGGDKHLNSGLGIPDKSTSDLNTTMNNRNDGSSMSFITDDYKTNMLALDKVNQYVGLQADNNQQNSLNTNFESNALHFGVDNKISTNVEMSKSTYNNNRLASNENKITEASNFSNKHNKELSGMGHINNNINTLNILDASSNIINNKENTITDGVGIAMSGFSGAPITNMAGALTGTSRGGLTVNANTINDPSFSLTSKTTESRSSSNQESSSVSGSNEFPSGSFIIGAGQPNSKVISAGSLESLSTSNANVGGVALGSRISSHDSTIKSISMPERAFKSNEINTLDTNQPKNSKPKFVKVDMSAFVPPPYEDPTSINTVNIQDQNTVKETTKAINENSATLLERQHRFNQLTNRLNPVTLKVTQHPINIRNQKVHQGPLDTDRVSNAALLNRIDNLRNQVTSSDSSKIVRQFNEHLINDASIHGGVSGSPSANSLRSIAEPSNIVRSTEHFGKPLQSDILRVMPQGQHNTRTSSINTLDQSGHPSVVVNRASFTNTGRDNNARTNEVSVALDMHDTTNQRSNRLSTATKQITSQPIVGSIFGTVENSSSNSLTQRFLEKSGITREPAVDFMTTFLQHSKPTRTLNRGNKNLQIVPLGSDMSNLSPNTDKIIIAGRQNDAQTVGQFGVADIYTRRQQLNPSQWQQLMAKVSHDPTPIQNVQNRMNVDYQTQNVIGTGETRPLTSNINQGSTLQRTGTLSGLTSKSNTRKADRLNTIKKLSSARKNNLRSAILFEAPGMTGHKSVTIRNYVPRSSRIPSARHTLNSRLDSVADVGQQSLQEFVGTQATAQKTSSFANTFRQKQKTGTEGVPVMDRNTGGSVNSISLPLKDRLITDPQVKSQGQLGEAGQKIQNEMNTFKLGRSILISDGVIPEFTGPNSVQRLPIDTNDLRTLSANGMRLGEPSILPNGRTMTVNNQQTMVDSSKTSASSLDLQGVRPINAHMVNNRPTNLGTLDSEMTSILRSRMGNIDSQLSNNRQAGNGLLSSQFNNNPVALGSIDMQSRTNHQNGIGSIGVLNSELTSNRLSRTGSVGTASNNQINFNTIDSQLLNNRPSRLGLLDSHILSNKQFALQPDTQTSSTGEISLHDIQGSSIARGLVSDKQGSSLSKRLGIAIGGNLNALTDGLTQGQHNFGQSQQNMGIDVNGNMNNAFNLKTDLLPSTSIGAIGSSQSLQNLDSTIIDQTGMPATNIEQRNLDTATILGLNSALKKQPMEATLFTSGSRFAVFGRADDVTGRSLGTPMQAKPIPARRMGVLGPIHDCRYKPDPTSEYYFVYKNGITQHRFRCALGTAFDEMTCECSIRVSDHGDCLEVHMDYNNGVVEDSSLNRLPIGNENVEITNSTSPIAGIALFGGDGLLKIWRYQNYDFRDHIMLKVQFRPGVGGDRLQPLISNCDINSPSIAIVYDNVLNEVILMLQTVNDTAKELRFRVNPDEWTDVTYIYDGQEFIGIVNGVRRYVSRENPHLLGIIGGEIKSTPAHGLIEIRDAAVVLGHCPAYGYYRGAMVDIQVYTCIPKDFRLE